VEKTQLDPVAAILNQAALETLTYSRGFTDEYGQPPTLASKVQHMRAVTQVMVGRDERFKLGQDYIEFGRVEITDNSSGKRYLLRSDGAVAIEESKRQDALFPSAVYIKSDVTLLVYKFHREGLDLSVAGTVSRGGRTRLVASGAPTFVGTWPYSAAHEDASFDQGIEDLFGDLGALDEYGEGEDGG
jgi:hypothetical protein